MAKALSALPMMDSALARGELCFDQVAALTHIAEPDTEAHLIEEAKQLSLRQLQSFVQLRGGLARSRRGAPEPATRCAVGVRRDALASE